MSLRFSLVLLLLFLPLIGAQAKVNCEKGFDVLGRTHVEPDRVVRAPSRAYSVPERNQLRRDLIRAVYDRQDLNAKPETPELAAEKLRLDKKIIDLASEHLATLGVIHRILKDAQGRPLIEILPGDSHVLNRRLRGLLEKDDSVRILFAPGFRKGPAYSDRADTILLGAEVVAAPDEKDFVESLFHEIRHWKTFQNLKARKEFPYYGTAFTGDLAPEGSIYRDFSFDELWAYQYSVRYTQHLVDTTTDPRWLPSRRNDLKKYAGQGKEIADRTLLLVDALLADESHLRATATFQVDANSGVVKAALKSSVNGKEFRVYLPLVESPDAASPRNGDLLVKQLRSLKTAATERQRDFSRVLAGLN